MDKDLLKKINDCLHSLNNRVTEKSVSYQVDSLVDELLARYEIESKDKNKLMALKDISDYNFRKKVIDDIVKKYVR